MERSRIQKENPSAAWRRAETVQTLWWFQRKSSPAGQTLLKSTQLWDSRPAGGRAERDLTLKKQSSATKEEDLLQQGQNITDKEQKMQRRRRQLLQQNWRISVDNWGRTGRNVPLGKASKMEERSTGGKRRKGTVVSSRWSKDSSYPQEDFPWKNQVLFFWGFLKKRNSLFLCIDRSALTSATKSISQHFHKSSTFLDKSLQSNLTLNSVVINVEAHPFKV